MAALVMEAALLYRKGSRMEVVPMIPPIIIPLDWNPDPKKAGVMSKVFLIVFTVSGAIAALFAWLVSLTTFPSVFHGAASILIMAAISAALASLIPLSLVLPIWISGFRGVRMLIAMAAFIIVSAGLILGLQFGIKWLPLP